MGSGIIKRRRSRSALLQGLPLTGNLLEPWFRQKRIKMELAIVITN
jgi:hypothetical protein